MSSRHGYFLIPLALAWGASLAAAEAPLEVSFAAADGGTVFAHLYEAGPEGVILAHGGVFDKESWTDLAGRLRRAGLTVLAIDFRGYGKSGPAKGRAGLENDLLGALTYLSKSGLEPLSIVGGSMGAAAAMRAAVAAEPATINRLVLLAPPPTGVAGDLHAQHVLFAVSAGDRFRSSVEHDFELAGEDKRLEVLPGDAHAQHVFATEHGERLARLIVGFLTEE